MAKDERIILIDADVVSHFIAAGEIIYIGKIFKFPIRVLDIVYNELCRHKKKEQEVENLLALKILELMPFPEVEEIKKEYFYIKNKMFKGDGESACMAVCRFQNDILASSNLTDIKNYCTTHKIDYLTTMDFLCEALRTGVFDKERCNEFITKVKKAGSKLPVNNMDEYTCRSLDFI